VLSRTGTGRNACLTSRGRRGLGATAQTRREQAKLLQETQQKIRALKIGSYRDTPKAIAFRSPHGILPKEIRPGNPSRNYAPAPFGAGNKPKPGTKSIYRKAGGLD